MTVQTPERVRCQWLTLCTNAATTVRSHPIFEVVPICGRCDEIAAKIDRQSRY